MSGASSGFALSLSASHLGFHVHAGFLSVLTGEAGVKPEFLAASSSGAFVGGLFAAGIDPVEIHRLMSEPEMRRAFWEWRGPLRGMAMGLLWRGTTGMLTGKNVLAFLKKLVGERTIEECSSPELSISATDIVTRSSVVFRSGPLAQTIVTSCAVPLLFRAIPCGSSLLWDGAVADSSPMDHLADDGRVRSILVHVVSTLPPRQPWTIANALGEAHETICKRILDLGIARARFLGKNVLVVESRVPRFPFGDKRGAAALFAAGCDSARRHAKDIEALRGSSEA